MANAGGNSSGGNAGMSWLDNFKPPSSAPPEQPPPAYEASMRDDDPSETSKAPEIDPSSSATEDASEARGDPQKVPEPETDTSVASGSSRRTSGTARPDPDLERPRPAEPSGAPKIAVPSVAKEQKRDAVPPAAESDAADDNTATIRSLRSELAVSTAAAEDATAALEAMTLKADTLARLLDEAGRKRDAASAANEADDALAKKTDDVSVSARLAASESKRADLESRVVSLSNDLSAAREIARSTGELADQSATYIAELKKKHRAVEARERALRLELDAKNAEVQDVRKNTHDAKHEAETLKAETTRLTDSVNALTAKLKNAEDALEDGRRERDGTAAAQNALESLREEHRALLDASHDFSRRLRDAEDAAADAELRAADAELACEAIRADAAAELERETEKLRDGRRGAGARDGAANETKPKPKTRASRSSLGEDDGVEADDAIEDAERRAREAEARARSLEAELRDRDAGAAEHAPTGTRAWTSRPDDADASVGDETDAAALRVAFERTKQALTWRAERAERALEAAQLLARPTGVTESDAELVRMRDAGRRAAETERLLGETRRALEACEASAREAVAAREAAESDARVLAANAEARAREFQEKERAFRASAVSLGGGISLGAAASSAETWPDVRETHAKRVTLRFLEARTFDEQQAVLPVLAAVQNWDPSEKRAVDKARAAHWEPAEKVLADRLSAAAEVDLGVTSAANALAGALGLGNVL